MKERETEEYRFGDQGDDSDSYSEYRDPYEDPGKSRGEDGYGSGKFEKPAGEYSSAGDFDFPENDDDFADEFVDKEDSRGSFDSEYTIKTTSFFEEYGDELKAAVRDVDEKVIFSEFDDEQIEEGLYQFPKKKRKKKHWLLKLLAAVVIIAAAAAFIMSPYFDIKTIKVEGEKKIKAEEIIKMSGVKSGMNIFKVSESDVSKALKKDAYFSSIKISRKLPDKLVITVRERNEAAFVLSGGEKIVIDNEGYVLRKTKKKVRLTQLDDLKITQAEVGEKLKVSNDVYFDKTLKILVSMENANIFFKKIVAEKVIYKAYIKDNFLCKGKADNIIKNLNNGNLGNVIKDLYSKGKKKGTIILTDGNLCSYSPKIL